MNTVSTASSAPTRFIARRAAGLALCLSLSLPLLALSTPAHAEESMLNPVTISGTRMVDTPPTDVRTACPKVDETIARRMAPLVHQIREEGVTTVNFRLQGQQVLSSQATGGPRAYRSQLRRAVGSLDCQGEPHVNQAYVMEVSFRHDASEGGMQQMVQIRPVDGRQLASAAATR